MKVVVSGRNKEMNSLLTALSGLLKGDASVRLPLHYYLSKPVDPMNLLAVLRGWLCR
jgi:hypothetical protein